MSPTLIIVLLFATLLTVIALALGSIADSLRTIAENYADECEAPYLFNIDKSLREIARLKEEESRTVKVE